MPKQLIEIDVPDGFEVDRDLYCKVRPCFSVNNFSIMIPFRRKLSYEGTPELAKALREAPDGGFTILPDNCVKVSAPIEAGFPESRIVWFGGRSGWINARLSDVEYGIDARTSVLSASAQSSPPEPVPIESDLSEQATRLLRHLGIERDWQWPEWLKAKWLICNSYGMWLASNAEPTRPTHNSPWILPMDSEWLAVDFTPGQAFVPPPCTDWRQSKRRNPQWKD